MMGASLRSVTYPNNVTTLIMRSQARIAEVTLILDDLASTSLSSN